MAAKLTIISRHAAQNKIKHKPYKKFSLGLLIYLWHVHKKKKPVKRDIFYFIYHKVPEMSKICDAITPGGQLTRQKLLLLILAEILLLNKREIDERENYL